MSKNYHISLRGSSSIAFFEFITGTYISDNKSKVIEGQLRIEGLVEYLERLNLPRKIWICEDATGINGTIEYDSSSNQLVGKVLPLDANTGMPVSFSFLARSADEILKNSSGTTSSLVYVVLALPLMPKIPPYILQIYSTDNKFTSQDIKHRWKYICEELKKYA